MLTKAGLKHIQNLKVKKYRQNYAEFIIEGDKLIKEAWEEKVYLKMLLATHQWIDENRRNIPPDTEVKEITEKHLKQISSFITPQQVIAVLPFFNYVLNEAHLNGWTVALDGTNDPGNLGTIIRTADWFGIKNIICSENCVDFYNPKVIQASMGSLFRVKVFYIDIQQYLKATTRKKYAATLSGKNIFKFNFPDEGILIIGSESHGISAELLNLCDEEITIPKFGNAESLNAGVACGVILGLINRK
jgi:TrmH family RNA methyltransferase